MNIETDKITIQELIKSRAKTPADLARTKRKISKKFKTSCPSNIDLLKAYHELVKNKRVNPSKIIENLLKTRPIRSLSGIVNVSVLTKHYPCPGKCIFCPTELDLPKSYLSGEPAVQRAKILKFNPELQVRKRIEMLKNQGHSIDKIELRIIGGSFTFYPEKYKTWFLKRCFDGANLKKSKSLKEAQKINEKTKHRIVGISIETRPDLITEKEIKKLRKLGVTMVEIGVQTVFDETLEYSKTNLKAEDIIIATKLLKDAGFKVMYQSMPNLPKSTIRKDEKAFEEIFKNQSFKPDWLKIYPCVVLKESKLYKLWKQGKYKSYSDKKLISLIKYIKTICPFWVRIARIYRDIPKQKIISGCKISNLREIIKKEMEIEKISCHCIRCREIKGEYKLKEKIYLFRENYQASDGIEIFLSFENKERTKLYSFLRLRIPSYVLKLAENSSLPIFPALQGAAIIRELHTYGQVQPLNDRGQTSVISPQHKGLGKKLIKEVEKIIYTEFSRSANEEFNLKKIAVISGIGVRSYYRKLGYRLKNTYMVKQI